MINFLEIPVIHVLLRYLEGEGVDTIFGIPGGPISPLYEALYDRNKIRHVLAKHEQGAAFMADGYARVRGGLGVCCATTGPGATNALTGLACSYTDSIPVLLISAQIATRVFGKGALQESTAFGVDLVEIFKSVTKMSTMLLSPAHAPELIRRVLRSALSGRRGPVHLNLPADLMKQDIPYVPVPPEHYRARNATLDREAIQEAVGLLLEAKRPCILAGHGVVVSRAWDELARLATELGIPVATTLAAKGALPEDHPLSLGVFGFAGHPRADSYLLSSNVDVLLTVGTSLGEMVTHAWHKNLQPTGALIQIDMDPEEIGKNYSADVGIVGDARAVLREMNEQIRPLAAERAPRSNDLLQRVNAEVTRYVNGAMLLSDAAPLKPQRVIHEMQQVLPADTLLFVDTGNCVSWAGHYFASNRPGSFFHCKGHGSMGHGLVSSIGGKVAAPGRPVVAIGGDAAFAMAGMDIHTAVDNRIPVVWIVLNNGGHGMVYHGDKILMNRKLPSSQFRVPLDIAGIARAVGARAYHVDAAQPFRRALEDALGSGEPCVIEAMIDPEEIPASLRERVRTLNEFFSGTLSDAPRSLRVPPKWTRKA